MTGLGRAEAVIEGVRYAWRLRSVNQRYLEISFRLPDSLSELEPELRKRLKERFARGQVDVSLHVRSEAPEAGELSLNADLLGKLIRVEAEALHIAGHDAARGYTSASRLLSWPGVVSERRPELSEEQLAQRNRAALSVFDSACETLEGFRRREGDALVSVLRELLGRIAEFEEQVRQRLPEVRQRTETRLRERLAELGGQVGVDETRLAQEVVFLLNRVDVSEELDRLRVHREEMTQTLESDEPIGRRLDFLCQELNREANTLCSKPQDPEISKMGVDLKVVIEKIREQVQNLQ
ncbi:YicC/YloC family endoribonuclease [Magnetofaba australis]|uniref:YicC family protein n=1 Tax=Magnetofaba australis IT-1 TaxID=1434232 RepID=A0A1Y2K0D2_9PROT|nr:YicC/YloC family endoribonuclease [Magnetofaba australis]OSM01429.1 hypothetical protein MAIT1_01388 [Magnetofaba australis IT-1]